MKRIAPRSLLLTGLGLFAGGFLYDLIFAGLPYQDPTPEMTANYMRHSGIASAVRWLGLGIILWGGAVGATRLVARQRSGSGGT